MKPNPFDPGSIQYDSKVRDRKALHIAFDCAAVWGELLEKGSLNHLGPKFLSANGAIPGANLSASMNMFRYFMKMLVLGVS